MISLHKKIVALTYLFEGVRASGEQSELSLAGDVTAAKDAAWYSECLLSTEVNGKDWHVICTQNWTLAYALHAIGKCKLVRPGWVLPKDFFASLSMKFNIDHLNNLSTLPLKKKNSQHSERPL